MVIKTDLNYRTKEVQMWLMNDETLYNQATTFMDGYDADDPYEDFIDEYGLTDETVPYNDFQWNEVNYEEMNNFLYENYSN